MTLILPSMLVFNKLSVSIELRIGDETRNVVFGGATWDWLSGVFFQLFGLPLLVSKA